MQILYAVAALGGVALVFGALLGVVARFFTVDSDSRVEAVREALPGANCGACGYAGCNNFAEAVVEGKAPTNGCIPGGSGAAAAIAAALGQEAAATVPMVATVFCLGDKNKARDLFVYDGIKDCAVAEKYGGGFKACADGCLGLGSCVRACPFDAIAMGRNGLPVVDEKQCTGCGLCARACPRGIIKMLPQGDQGHLVLCNSHARGKAVTQACEVGCMACRACVKACPREAIAMENNLAVIDLAKCDDCGKCVLKCRPGTIHPRREKGAAKNATAAKAAASASA